MQSAEELGKCETSARTITSDKIYGTLALLIVINNDGIIISSNFLHATVNSKSSQKYIIDVFFKKRNEKSNRNLCISRIENLVNEDVLRNFQIIFKMQNRG